MEKSKTDKYIDMMLAVLITIIALWLVFGSIAFVIEWITHGHIW